MEEIEFKNLDEDLKLDIDGVTQNIKITIKGNKDTIEKLTKEDLEIYSDLNMVSIGDNLIYISFNTPPDITVEEIDPQPIILKIIEKG